MVAVIGNTERIALGNNKNFGARGMQSRGKLLLVNRGALGTIASIKPSILMGGDYTNFQHRLKRTSLANQIMQVKGVILI